jgi:hypothetical protein
MTKKNHEIGKFHVLFIFLKHKLYILFNHFKELLSRNTVFDATSNKSKE